MTLKSWQIWDIVANIIFGMVASSITPGLFSWSFWILVAAYLFGRITASQEAILKLRK